LKESQEFEGGKMKHLHVSSLCLAVALYSGSAFAQHGHIGGTGHGAASHDSTNGASSGSTHRMTIDQQLSKNTQLSDKIQKLTGMPAQQACDGFKNLGQCVAAAHVSKNLGMSFACMKSDMTGQAPPSGSNCPTGTGKKSMSLGKAIQTLDPNANSKTEAKKGAQQASQDLKNNS
jgi:hypothetical protein